MVCVPLHRMEVSAEALTVNDFTLILQRMPNGEQVLEKTTCRHPLCLAPDHASQPGSYRVSIEKAENLEEQNEFSQSIPLTPLHPWSAKLKNGERAKTKRGLGKEVKAWWCLECIENIWLELDGFQKQRYQYKRSEDPELWEIFRFLQPEERAAGLHDSEYHLSAPQRYALEKWRAVAMYEAFEAYGIDVGSEAVFGVEPNTLYLEPDTRDIKGIDEVTGQAVEVKATRVAGKKLSDALRYADDEVHRRHQLLRQATPAAYTTTTKSAAPVTSVDLLQASDVQAKVEEEEVGVEATVKEECAASSEQHLIVKLRVDREAFNALLEKKAPPAKKRRLVKSCRSRELGAHEDSE